MDAGDGTLRDAGSFRSLQARHLAEPIVSQLPPPNVDFATDRGPPISFVCYSWEAAYYRAGQYADDLVQSALAFSPGAAFGSHEYDNK